MITSFEEDPDDHHRSLVEKLGYRLEGSILGKLHSKSIVTIILSIGSMINSP